MPRLDTTDRPRTPRALLAALVALVAVLASCTGDADVGAEESQALDDQVLDGATAAALPDWLSRVYPEPGAELSGNQEVQLEYVVDESSDQIVRLVLDGTDVMIHADVRPGEVTYDPEVGAAPVELSPGEHTATAELVEVSDSGEELIDSFEWTFSIL